MHAPKYGGSSPVGLRDMGEFGLHIVGVPDSLAEIVMLKTMSTIMSEWGAPLARVRLNALGDKDSKARFEREVSGYLRKHAVHLHEGCRDGLGKDLMAPYACESALCRSVVESGPRAMNFLSEKSRLHFKEVLEHLEKLSLPYEFDDLLMIDEREPRMLFAFDLDQEDATVLGAAGGRFDDHFRTYAPRKEAPGVSASVFFRKKGLSPDSFKLGAPSIAPAVYFVQLGLRAKLEGLQVVDLLREARIPILQSFDSAKLSPQLSAAKEAGVSHLIIMGAREALDRTVLVRAMDDSHQQIVGLSELPRFLKTLR
jgi:histidyl-tRNA synthetase